jgi:hypothetical protein
MGIETDTNLMGQKVFFVYPSPYFQNDIASEFINQEFEVCFVKEHANLKKVLKDFPKSIVFINIEGSLPEKEWELWIRSVLKDPVTAEVKIGILAESHNEQYEQKYTETLKLPCGYTVISKSDPAKTIKQLVIILTASEARGRRKYVRASSEDKSNTINIPYNNSYLKGVIKNISAAGFCCCFEQDPDLGKNALCKDIQIRLQKTIIKAEGSVFGSREDGPQKIYVFLFTQRVDPETRFKIRTCIQQLLQLKIDKLLGIT